MVLCEFLEYTTVLSDNVGTIGLFKHQPEGTTECVSYDGEDGALIETARICALLSPIFALIGMILVITELCCCRFCCSRLLELVFYVLAIILGGCTFVIWGSDFCTVSGGDCNMGRDAWLMVIALIVYFVAAVLMCATPKPKPVIKRRREKEHEHEQLQKHENEQVHESEQEDENQKETGHESDEKQGNKAKQAA
jgi:hypothetical protein